MKQQYIQATSNEAQSRDGLETLIESILFNQSWVVCQNPATTGASMSEPYQHPCLNISASMSEPYYHPCLDQYSIYVD